MKAKKGIKQVIAMLLCAVLVVSGVSATKPMKAQGASNVLTISSVRELKEFAQKVNSGNSYKGYTVKLTRDLAFDGMVNNFTTIGTNGYSYHPFEGVFDGCGHTISGINITAVENVNEDSTGLFGSVDGTVKNLTLKDCDFSSRLLEYHSTGMDIGSIASTLCTNGTIDNCHVIGGSVRGTGDIGGLIGDLSGGTIRNSSTSARVERGEDNGWSYTGGTGGIVGKMRGSAMVLNSFNMGDVFRGREANPSGGIVGGQESGTIQNCYNVGKADYGIAYAANGIVSNSYCSESSSEANFYSMKGVEQGCKAFPASDMATDEFLTLLNKGAVNSVCRNWEFRSDVSNYPVIVKNLPSQTIKVNVSGRNYKATSLKRGSYTFNIGATAKTRVIYRVVTGRNYISVNAKGKVVVKKNTPKGTYKITVTAVESAKYKSAARTIIVRVK